MYDSALIRVIACVWSLVSRLSIHMNVCCVCILQPIMSNPYHHNWVSMQCSIILSVLPAAILHPCLPPLLPSHPPSCLCPVISYLAVQLSVTYAHLALIDNVVTVHSVIGSTNGHWSGTRFIEVLCLLRHMAVNYISFLLTKNTCMTSPKLTVYMRWLKMQMITNCMSHTKTPMVQHNVHVCTPQAWKIEL